MPSFLTRERSLRWLAGAGYGLGLAVLAVLMLANGGRSSDAHAYWMAGRHVLEGAPLYVTGVAVQTLDAWKYPPLFAQALAPFSLMPELVFDWGWRIICFLCLRALAGTWRNVGLALLFPPVWDELNNVNVTFPVAYLAMLALRGRPTFLPVAIALKFGPVLLVPFILLRRGAADRRKLLIGMAAFAGLCTLSLLTAPTAWHDYVASVGPQAGGDIAGPGVLSFASSASLDLAFRAGVAIAATVVAIAIDEERLAWVAAVVTVPVLFFTRLAPLIAVFAWKPIARVLPRLREPIGLPVPATV